MSAPETRDPLFVNTKDGVCWKRQHVDRDGNGLYALADVVACPAYVLVSFAELAERGVVGIADVLPVPVGPEPQALPLSGPICSEAEARAAGLDIAPSVEELDAMASTIVAAGDPLSAEVSLAQAVPLLSAAVTGLRARVAELEAERKKYVGAEPTIAEEMAYLSRCIDSVLDLCDAAEGKGITSGGPFTVEAVRKAADGLVERRSYPPALPWARLMDDEDRTDFLNELADSATTHASSHVVLADVEDTIARWRLVGEAQHGHTTAPGLDAVTRSFVPVASLREDVYESPLHHEYRVGHDLPETGGAK